MKRGAETTRDRPAGGPIVVIDSSVAIKWLVEEDDSATALRLLEAWETGRVSPVAPAWIDVEVGNILWKKARRNEITHPEASEHLKDFLELEFSRVPADALLPAALDLALRFGTSVYDSLYLALSECESRPFVTADERLVNAVTPARPRRPRRLGRG